MNSDSQSSLLNFAVELGKSFNDAKQAHYAEQNRCTTEIVAMERTLQSEGVDQPFYFECDSTLVCGDEGDPYAIKRLEWSRCSKSGKFRLQFSRCHYVHDPDSGDVFPVPGESKPLAEAKVDERMELYLQLPKFLEAFKKSIASGRMFLQRSDVNDLH